MTVARKVESTVARKVESTVARKVESMVARKAVPTATKGYGAEWKVALKAVNRAGLRVAHGAKGQMVALRAVRSAMATEAD